MRRLVFDDPRLSRRYERDVPAEADLREEARDLIQKALEKDPLGSAWGDPPPVEEALSWVTVGQGETVA